MPTHGPRGLVFFYCWGSFVWGMTPPQFGSWLQPYSRQWQELAHRFEGPDGRHPLGRDDLGRHLLSRSIWGAAHLWAPDSSSADLHDVCVLAGASAGLEGGAMILVSSR